MRADVYVSAPGPSEALARRLDPQLLHALLAVPGIARAQRGAPRGGGLGARRTRAERAAPGGGRARARFASRRVSRSARGPRFAAVRSSSPSRSRGASASSPGEPLTLTTAAGPRAFTIAGVYREYGNDRGEVLMDLGVYQRLWRDEAIGGLGIYLAPGVAVPRVRRGSARRGARPAGALHPLQRRAARAVDAHLRAHLRHHARAVLAGRRRGGDRTGERAARLGAGARPRARAAAHAWASRRAATRSWCWRRRSSWDSRRSSPRCRPGCSPRWC